MEARIKDFTEVISSVQNIHPELRIGELVKLALDSIYDLEYIDDDVLIKRIQVLSDKELKRSAEENRNKQIYDIAKNSIRK